MNPYRINPATIMPKFADDEGRTGLIDLLEGDAQRQFDGIWRHLKDLSTEWIQLHAPFIHSCQTSELGILMESLTIV